MRHDPHKMPFIGVMYVQGDVGSTDHQGVVPRAVRALAEGIGADSADGVEYEVSQLLGYAPLISRGTSELMRTDHHA